MIYLSVRQEGIEVSLLGPKNDTVIVVKTHEALLDAIEKLAKEVGATWEQITERFIHSSSMNFPEESTDDSEVLALVEYLMTD